MIQYDKPVVFILVDAFRWDYLNPIDTPFLWNCAHSGLYVQKLITTSGFTQRSALFCGTFPNETGNFTMFSYDPAHSPFRFLRKMTPLLRFAQKFIDKRKRGSRRLNLWLRYQYIYPRASKYAVHPPTAEIPLYLLPDISITEDQKPIYEQHAFKVESIFDIFQRMRLTFLYFMFPVVNCQDDEVYEMVINHINNSKEETDIYFLQFSDSDLYVHKYGTESTMRRKVVGEIDRKIRDIWDIVERKVGKATLVIVGDHGMMNIEDYFDVATIIHSLAKSLGLKHGRDYFLFLDSTLARIWKLKDNSAISNFFEALKNDHEMLSRGKWLSPEIAKKYRIPYPDPKYGDLVWWASPGVLIYPDYFHGHWEQYRAMHGYEPSIDEMKGMAIIYGEQIVRRVFHEAHLIDLCPTICDLLGVPFPSSNKGVSLLSISR